MKVTLEKHGGLAAGVHRMPKVLDSDSLPGPAASELAQLVTEAADSSVAEEDGPGRGRDTMSYKVTVEGGGRSTVIRGSDSALSSELAALIKWIDTH